MCHAWPLSINRFIFLDLLFHCHRPHWTIHRIRMKEANGICLLHVSSSSLLTIRRLWPVLTFKLFPVWSAPLPPGASKQIISTGLGKRAHLSPLEQRESSVGEGLNKMVSSIDPYLYQIKPTTRRASSASSFCGVEAYKNTGFWTPFGIPVITAWLALKLMLLRCLVQKAKPM